MAYFRDSVTGKYYDFDDDVIVSTEGGIYSFKTSFGMALDKLPTTLLPSDPPPEPEPVPSVSYVPAWLIRQRLTAVNLWDQAVSAMTPAQQLEFATLQEGIDPSDQSVIALLAAIGADPAVILAAPT